jgi:hypothetical protein
MSRALKYPEELVGENAPPPNICCSCGKEMVRVLFPPGGEHDVCPRCAEIQYLTRDEEEDK